MPTLVATAISQSQVATLQNQDVYTHTDFNSSVAILRTTINNIVTDLASLNTADGGLADNNTWTGTNTFQANATFYNVFFTSTYGFGDSFILIDSDNTGAAATCQVRFERGSSGGDAYFEWDTTRYNFWADAGTTRSIVRFLDGAAANDGMTYGQGVKATGTVAETVTGVKTFSSYPLVGTSYAAPTTNLQVAVKKYVDDQTASLVTGGVIQQTSAPAVTNNNLWVNTTDTSNYEFFRANGTVFAPVTGIFQGTSAPTVPTVANERLWIDTTSTASSSLKRYDGSAWKQVIPATIDAATTFSGALTFSTTTLTTGVATFTASPVFNGGFSVAASQTISMGSNVVTLVADPTSAQHAATKNYVDTTSPKKFSATAGVTVTSTTLVTVIGSGVGSLTIAANTLIAGSVIHVHASGIFTTDGAAGNLTFQAYLGAATLEGNNPTTPANSLTNAWWSYDAYYTVRTTGASGTLQNEHVLIVGGGGDATAGTAKTLPRALGTSTIDTTAANAYNLKANWEVGNAETMTCSQFVMYVYI